MRLWLFGKHRTQNKAKAEEREARLVKAEADVQDLKGRAVNAVRILNERDRRNHWREAITELITGAP